MKDSQPRLGGGLQYVPAIGESGLRVALCGKFLDSLQPVASRSRGRLLNFEDVDVLDLTTDGAGQSEGTWYTQPTSATLLQRA